MKHLFHSLRAYLGGIALGLGIIGLFLFALGIPFTIFNAHFWAGMGFREGPQPTAEQLRAAVNHELWWGFLHRLAPLFAASLALISYGLFEAYQEQEHKP